VDWRNNFKGSTQTAPILIIVIDFYVFRHFWAQSTFGLSSLLIINDIFINVIKYFINPMIFKNLFHFVPIKYNFTV
jgi:hypothetical protein